MRRVFEPLNRTPPQPLPQGERGFQTPPSFSGKGVGGFGLFRLFVALVVLPVAHRALPAQDVLVPAIGAPAGRLSPPVTLPTDLGAFAAPPGDSGVPMMLPPLAPPGYTPVPRGDAPIPNPLERRLSLPSVQLTEAGGQPARTANENFDGDFGGVFYKRLITTGFTTRPRVIGFSQRVVGNRITPPNPATTTTTTTTSFNTGVPVVTITNTVTSVATSFPIIVNDPIVVQETVATQRLVRLTLAARYSGILITDNDNPRPQDRVYGGYNFYDNIGGRLNPGLGGVDLQRQMVGFEKTFLDGDASFGMRLPFVQQYGPAGVGGTNNVGDLTLIWKYAIVNDRATGDLWSAGLVLTTPTGSGDATLWDGSRAPHSVLFQPWTGFVRTFDRAYVQGVTSLVVPTDGRDPTLWNNSVAAGYYVYRSGANAWLTAVVPTAELHVRTPLTSRNPNGLAYLQDEVNVTGGVHFRFNRAVLSAAVCVPVAGPRPWSVEAMSFLNFYF